MCIEVAKNNMTGSGAAANKKVTYSVKRLLKQLFKQQHDGQCSSSSKAVETASLTQSIASLESLENSRNASLETAECISLESLENEANERRSYQSGELEDYDFAEIGVTDVPVHFVRTAHGTFFWTAAAPLPADSDLIEPLACRTTNQIAMPQPPQHRWAQA